MEQLRALKWYAEMVEKRPILTQSIMTATMYCISDIIIQNAISEWKDQKYDIERTLQWAVIGLCFSGPFSACWIQCVQKLWSYYLTLVIHK